LFSQLLLDDFSQGFRYKVNKTSQAPTLIYKILGKERSRSTNITLNPTPPQQNPIKSISRKQERESMLFDVVERSVHQFRQNRSYLYRFVAGDNRDSTN
jgi:hypothetical protein